MKNNNSKTKSIKDFELAEIISCSKTDSTLKASKKMKEKSSRYLIVLDKKTPVGIISSTDIAHKVVAENKNPEKTKAEEIMTHPVFVMKHTESIEIATIAMLKKGIASCPVINDKEECIGLIHLSDLIKDNNGQ